MIPPLLRNIPDPRGIGFDSLAAWLDERMAKLKKVHFSEGFLKSFAPFEWKEPCALPFGVEASPVWRRLFLATLLADWACYDRAASRVDFARLKYVLSTAYPFARVWFGKLSDGTLAPVGYSLAYPLSKFVYEAARRTPETIRDRGVFLPARGVKNDEIKYAYAFNISVIEPLRGTVCSQRMIRALQKDAAPFDLKGLMAVTVDAAGRKFSRLAGMDKIAELTIGGEKEGLYAGTPRRAGGKSSD
jgi:hypothetical protein